MSQEKNAMEDTLEFIQKMSYHYDTPLIASFMVVCGLGLYKRYLTEDDYQNMCEKIYSDRDRIREI